MKRIKDLTNGEVLMQALGLSVLAVASITPFLLNASANDYYPPDGTQLYGLNGRLSGPQIRDLLYLDFSRGQSYNAIKNRFGFPMYRDAEADYYQMPNGHFATIYYNRNNIAVGLRLGGSN